MNVAKLLPEIKSAESQQSTGPQKVAEQLDIAGTTDKSQVEYYFIVPNRLCDADPDKIRPIDHAVYNHLKRNRLRQESTVQLRINFLARRLGVCRRTIERSLVRLESVRGIARVSGKSAGESDIFWFPEVPGGATPESQGCDTRVAGVRHQSRRGATPESQKKQIEAEVRKEENRPAGAVGTVENSAIASDDAAAILCVLADLQIDRDDGSAFKIIHAARAIFPEVGCDTLCAAVRRIGGHLPPDVRSPVGVICYRLQHELHPAVRAAGELHRQSEAAAKDPLHFRPDLKGA
jgi:hypothetical protein